MTGLSLSDNPVRSVRADAKFDVRFADACAMMSFISNFGVDKALTPQGL